MSLPAVPMRRWTRHEYEQLIGLGVFKPEEHLELIDGLVIVSEPRNAPHATAVLAVQEALRAVVGTRWQVRPEWRVALDDDSEPEPDVSVMPGSSHASRFMHPSRPGLVVEVADTTLTRDRRKAGLYARAAVEEFWIVNLVDQVLEVSRRPQYAPEAPFAWVYADTRMLRRDDVVTPLVAPGARIRVGDLLP